MASSPSTSPTAMFRAAERDLHDFALSRQAHKTRPMPSNVAASPITPLGDNDSPHNTSSNDSSQHESSNDSSEDDGSEDDGSDDDSSDDDGSDDDGSDDDSSDDDGSAEDDRFGNGGYGFNETINYGEDWSENGGDGFDEVPITAAWVQVAPPLQPPISTTAAAPPTPATQSKPPFRETYWPNVERLRERARRRGSAESPPELWCCICHRRIVMGGEEYEDPLVLPCGHFVGKDCWGRWRERHNSRFKCPICEMRCASKEGWVALGRQGVDPSSFM